jgi:UDP-N-acetylmuramate--alanine ligase
MTLSDLFRDGAQISVRDLRGAHVHLIGIGGSGMAGLAAILLRIGARVSGTDQNRSAATERLAQLGARVRYDQADAAMINADTELVLASAAIAPDHPELKLAGAHNVRVLKYAQMLGVLMEHFEGVAVSGTHGKSTSTAWLAYTMRRADLDPNFVIGAESAQLGGGSGVGSGRHFLVEACEYDRSFLNLRPTRAVILNIDEDHLDCYRDLAAIEEAFTTFATQIRPGGLAVLNAADPACRRVRDACTCRVETFGENPDADWQATDLRLVDGRYAFDLRHRGESLGPVHLGLSGRHNVMNALAVAALATDCGVGPDALRAGLQTFRGAKRRLEVHLEQDGVIIADDYAHHPAEIRATLAAARERFQPKRLWVVFQPHQHSRTRFLLNDFAQSFAMADRVLVPDIYFVRDSERDRQAVSADDLVSAIAARGGNAEYTPDFDDLTDRIAADLQPGDVVLTMGAGNIWKVADALVRRVRRNLPA